jgi:hypothetical protein
LTDEERTAAEINARFSEALSRHGHGFHYAVLERARALRQEKRSPWILEADEFPVEVNGSVTHVDFVLRTTSGQTYLIAECKRVDPAMARWSFVEAPYTWQGAQGNEVVIQEAEILAHHVFDFRNRVRHTEFGSYRIGLELKTEAKGDGVGKGEEINRAATQVLRGMNGLLYHLFGSHASYSTRIGRVMFLPVIFTTAELWVSKVDLRESDLRSGRLALNDAKRVNRLWFSHNQSPNIAHKLSTGRREPHLPIDLPREFARSIAVVSADGVDEFLSWQIEEFLFD